MKKVFCALLAALTLLAAAVVPAYAVDRSKSYLFELSIDGGDTTHAAAFKNQSCLGFDMYLFLHNYLIKRSKDSFCFRNLPIFVPVTII